MAKPNITKLLECLYEDQKYDHTLHIPREYKNDISVLSSTINTICDMLNMISKNQKLNHDSVEQQLYNLNIKTSKIEQKIQSLGEVVDLDLKTETKEQIQELTKTVNNFIMQQDEMNYPGDNKIPRLFYGTEDIEEIMVLQNKERNEEEYNNIVEILDYWKTIYKDPEATMDERNHILHQIRLTCLEYEDLLSYFNYDINMLSDDESTSSESNEDDNEINALSDSETDPEEKTSDLPKKRKANEDLPEFSNQEAFEEYLRTTQDKDKEFINTTEHASSSGIKTEPDHPSPSYTRRDDMNKQTVAQHGTYLDLSHIPFKDQEKTVDDWAQSMSILITNYKNVWTKERFLDYIAATLQGDTLQWLKQWENSPEGTLQKLSLLTNFKDFDNILKSFAQIIKEHLCGATDEKIIHEDAEYILSKIELCNICQFEEYSQLYKKYYFKIKPESSLHWLNQFFHKLPNPWDELAIKGYPDFITRINKHDNLGFRINFVLRLITDRCVEVRAKKQVKNQISNNPRGRKCCDKLLRENWKIGCNPQPRSSKKRRYKWKPFKKKKFSKKKKYIRKKKQSEKNQSGKTKKHKKCRCYICNEEGHYAPECPKKGKNTKKMVKMLEENNLEILFGEEISDNEEILYELETESDSSEDEEFIFMLKENIKENPEEELQSIRLKDVIGEEINFSNEQLQNLEKFKYAINKENIYKYSRFQIFSHRIFEQFSGNTTAQCTEEGTMEIPLFDKKKIERWRKKYPDIRYVHIGLIQITITALFRQGLDTPILAVVFDKRLSNPLQSMIGGIQSNLVNGIVWFNIKPNFFLSITDRNIENSVKIKIQLKNLSMDHNSQDLAIQWRTIHELTRLPQTSTKDLDKNIVELFEPRPFDTEIQPTLLHWKDLEIPKQWLFNNFVGESSSSKPATIEFRSSGNNLYFRDKRAQSSKNWQLEFPHRLSLQENRPPLVINNDSESEKNNDEAIALKQVQIPIMPGTNYEKEKEKEKERNEIIKLCEMYSIPNGNENILFAPSQGKKKYTYVLGEFKFTSYKPYSLCSLIDTGATVCACRPNALPPEKWTLMKHPINVTGIKGKDIKIEHKAKKVAIWLNGVKYIIPKIIAFPEMNGDVLLGNNFIFAYYPILLDTGYIALDINNGIHKIPFLPQHKYKCHKDFAPSKRGDPETIDQLDKPEPSEKHFGKTKIQVLSEKHWVYKILEENFSEDPLKLWSKSPRYCALKLRNPDVIIRVKPMIYTRQDINEFDIQIKELKEKHLIEETMSPHSSPAFMVRNHAEIKRGKARMVINYKRLNEQLEFDGYFIPRKDVLINQTKGAKIFSKFDCKSGFWQLKLTEESKPLTAFSTPCGHYHWNVMPFGLNIAPQIFQRWMDSIFKDLKDFCVVYIDDILIFSKNREDHKRHLQILCSKFQKHGIILSPKKIDIEQESIDFLGITLNHSGIKLQEHIVSKVRDFPEDLTDKKQLQSLLGILNYGRNFIKGLSKKEIPLIEKLKKNKEFHWTEKDKKLLQQIKQDLNQLPEVYFPKPGDKLILETDASDKCWGCVLKAIPAEKWEEKNPPINENSIRARKQHIPKKLQKEELVCGYNSGKFKPNEIKYIIFEKELLAIKLALKRFHIYLAPENFIIRTDNQAVRDFLINKRNIIEGRRLKWYNYIAMYTFEVEHLKGSNNFLADYLSRYGEGQRDNEPVN